MTRTPTPAPTSPAPGDTFAAARAMLIEYTESLENEAALPNVPRRQVNLRAYSAIVRNAAAALTTPTPQGVDASGEREAFVALIAVAKLLARDLPDTSPAWDAIRAASIARAAAPVERYDNADHAEQEMRRAMMYLVKHDPARFTGISARYAVLQGTQTAVAWIVDSYEVDLDGLPYEGRTKSLDWQQSAIESLPVGAKLCAVIPDQDALAHTEPRS